MIFTGNSSALGQEIATEESPKPISKAVAPELLEAAELEFRRHATVPLKIYSTGASLAIAAAGVPTVLLIGLPTHDYAVFGLITALFVSTLAAYPAILLTNAILWKPFGGDRLEVFKEVYPEAYAVVLESLKQKELQKRQKLIERTRLKEERRKERSQRKVRKEFLQLSASSDSQLSLDK